MDLRRVDLNLLVSLHHLLDERQVTAAADRMRISQPSMSAALSRLRRLLDDPLLIRAGRQLVLTPFAESLIAPLDGILRDVADLLRDRPQFDPRQDARTFSVAATDYMTFVFLRWLVRTLRDHAPGVRLTVEPVLADYAQQLRSGRIDMLILPSEVAEDVGDFERAELFADRFIGLASADNPHIDGLTSERFSSLPYLAYRVNGDRSNVDKQLDALGVARNVEMTTESFVVPLLIIAGSDMVAMVHERAIALREPTSGLRTFAPPVPLTPIHQYLYWHPRRSGDPAHAWLRELIVDLASDEQITSIKRPVA